MACPSKGASSLPSNEMEPRSCTTPRRLPGAPSERQLGASEWAEELIRCSGVDMLWEEPGKHPDLNGVCSGRSPKRDTEIRPCVMLSISWGDNGRAFRRSFWRLFWNHI